MVGKKKNKQKKNNKMNNPVAFFKSIGIKPEKGKVNIKIDRIMRKRFGNEITDMYWDEENTDKQSHAELIYSDLNLARIWYGTDFKLTIRIAKLLSSIEVPDGSDILDVGGGPGALSFWMSKIWNVNEITRIPIQMDFC